EVSAVIGTPLDFTDPYRIGKRIDSDYGQLKLAQGYDHNWVLNKKEDQQELQLAAEVWVPQGRKMSVYTTKPGMQVYTGNFLNNVKGKNGQLYSKRRGICLQTQHFPNSPNQPNFPSARLTPVEKYRHKSIYRLS